MKKSNKRAWLRVVEAVIAILIVFGAVLFIVSKQTYRPDPTDSIYQKEDSILWVISKNETLRTMVLNQQKVQIENEIGSMIPASWNYSVCIISNITQICRPTTPLDKDVYVKEVLITSTLQTYSPQKLRLFVWQK